MNNQKKKPSTFFADAVGIGMIALALLGWCVILLGAYFWQSGPLMAGTFVLGLAVTMLLPFQTKMWVMLAMAFVGGAAFISLCFIVGSHLISYRPMETAFLVVFVILTPLLRAK